MLRHAGRQSPCIASQMLQEELLPQLSGSGGVSYSSEIVFSHATWLTS
jgi:hypothetical protein